MQLATPVPTPAGLAHGGPVTVFPGEPIAAQLRDILDDLDTAHRLAEGGYSSTHDFQRKARAALADLIAELSE